MNKILIVDDEFLMRQALRIMLARFPGYEIVGETGNGKEAVCLAEIHSPDIIFMDIMLHGINGLEVGRMIRRKNPHATIVIITGYHVFEFAKQAMEIGIKHYLLKPFSVQELQQIMQWHGETHLIRTTLIDTLIEELYNKSFEEASTFIVSMVRQIFAATAAPEERYRELKKIVDRLPPLNCGLKKNKETFAALDKLFCIDESVCLDERRAELWLFEVIDEAFKRKGIQTCPHLGKVFSYIEDHIHTDISLNLVSDFAGLSVSYLSRIFKKRLGTNFARYVNIKKIKRSKQILKYSQLSINDIAFELGYNEANYFCKVFKKTEHITPSQYRENIRRST